MPTTESPSRAFDAIVLGGSYAGLSAALPLARARRRVLVIDAGVRRNRFAATSHNFLGQDGRAPAAIAADGRAQLMAYPTVQWVDDTAVQATAAAGAFAVSVTAGDTFTARRLVLATGVVDDLPPLEGLAERWGRHVFHCPYCHGYELDQGRIGVLAFGPLAFHHAMMLPDWGQVTLFTNAAFEPEPEQRAALTARGVVTEAVPVRRIVDAATVELADDRQLPMDGLFAMGRTRMAGPAAEQLGCAFDESPMGTFIRTDPLTKETTVPGVFACGDAARAAGSVALAAGDGVMAGVGAHQSLIFR